MKTKKYMDTITIIAAAFVVSISFLMPCPASAADSESVTVNVEQFPTAETHHMMKISIDSFDCLGKWSHMPGFTPIDKQNVVRMNRDTLYSSLMLDLTEPATITMPDPMVAINQFWWSMRHILPN